jgi:hypothetical protein
LVPGLMNADLRLLTMEGALTGEEGTLDDLIGARGSAARGRVGAEVLAKVGLEGDGGGMFSSLGDGGA